MVFVQCTPVKRILGAGHTESGGIKWFAKSAHLKHQPCYYTSSKVRMLCFDEEKDYSTLSSQLDNLMVNNFTQNNSFVNLI